MRGTRVVIATVFAVALIAAGLLVPVVRRELGARLGRHTIEERIKEIGPRVQPLWESRLSCGTADVEKVVIVVLKHERELRVYAGRHGAITHVAAYPVLAASGTSGPKLQEGDRQVPEGLYGISFLNPNSRFHLSLRVDYPNDEDMLAARADGRDAASLGGDIMIHGGAKSIGCVAIGDEAMEELFWLVATAGKEQTAVVLSPGLCPKVHMSPLAASWVKDRYERISFALRELGVQGCDGG